MSICKFGRFSFVSTGKIGERWEKSGLKLAEKKMRGRQKKEIKMAAGVEPRQLTAPKRPQQQLKIQRIVHFSCHVFSHLCMINYFSIMHVKLKKFNL